MRYFKQLSKDGKTVVTLSLWGEEGHEEEVKHILEEILKELEEK